MIRDLLFAVLLASAAGCAVAPAEDVPAFVPALSARVDEWIAAGDFETADAEVLRLSEPDPDRPEAQRPKWARDLRARIQRERTAAELKYKMENSGPARLPTTDNRQLTTDN